MGILRLGGVVYRAIRVHSEQPWPHECCGALPGKSEAEGGLVSWPGALPQSEDLDLCEYPRITKKLLYTRALHPA